MTPPPVLGLAGAAVALSLLSPVVPQGATGPAVTGYALPSLRPAVVRREAGALTTLTVVAAGLRPSGAGAQPIDPRSDRLAEVARARGVRAELLLSNWSNELGDFDARALHLLLSEPDHIAAVAADVAAQAAAGRWDGVNIDLERVRERDAAGLVALAAALREALPEGASLSIDVSGRTTVRGYAQAGYDLAGLSAVVDVVQLMTYDQHGPGWSGPGPVGGLGWTRDCLAAAQRAGVPGDRLDLGVAGYGYLWRRGGEGRTVTPAGARRRVARADVRPRWHPRVGEWSARLPDGTRLRWSDARSFAARRDLATELGLHGLAVWRLGSADRLPQP